MKKSYVGYFLIILIFSHFFFEQSCIASSIDGSFLTDKKVINLTNIYFHKGMLSDRLICYFDDQPVYVYHPAKPYNKTPKRDIEFFLPRATPQNAAVKDSMTHITETQEQAYSIAFHEVTTPVPGLKITISYDPEKIICQYAPCYSITAEKGLIFNLHHKNVLERIANKTDKILHTVQHKPQEKPRIMLDFGHGGLDCGTIASNNIKEKDINLAVGTKVARLLRNKGYQVYLTRDDDQDISLDGRTKMANELIAHLFVSIHSNSAPSHKVSGIETFWSSRTFDKATITSDNKKSHLLVTDAMNRIDQSSKLLAEKIHTNIIDSVNNVHPVKNRFVKQSLAQVLIGTDMPGALVEIGFLSNPLENKKLQDPHYQLLLAQGITNGIEEYCRILCT